MTIDVVFKAVDQISQSVAGIEKSIGKLSGTMTQFGSSMLAINQSVEAFDRMGQAVDEITAPFREFEQSMAELSSITGIAGDDLAKLGQVARRTGVDSGLGAKGAAEAFALLASQIDVSKIGLDGLVGLQEKTITLAQAAGMSMDESANAMAGTINQFGLQATEANRVINVLAAGSKYGAASIPDLAQSFKVVGAAANAAGLSIEDTAGVIEVLSKNNLKGAEAGTAMRNIMLKMQTTLGVDFSKTSMADALTALKPKMKDAAYMAKVFGMESMAAAQFLIANSDSVREMTGRVTDTNVASEQAAINTDTWNFSLDVQAAKMNEWLMSITESQKGLFSLIQTGSKYMRLLTSFAPLFAVVKTGVMGAFNGIKWLTKGVAELGGKSRLTAAALAVKNAALATGRGMMAAYHFVTNASMWAMVRHSVATKAAAVWTGVCAAAQQAAAFITELWGKRTLILTAIQGGLTKALAFARTAMVSGMLPALGGIIAATWAWTVALLANPITWIVAGIMALVGAIIWCWNSFAEFRAVIYTIWDALKGFGEALWNFLVAPFEAVWGFVKGIGNFFGSLFGGDSIEDAGSAFSDSMGKGIDASQDRLKKGAKGMSETVSSIGSNYDTHLATEEAKDAERERQEAAQKAGGSAGFAMPNMGSMGVTMPNVSMPETAMPSMDFAGAGVAMPEMAMPSMEQMAMPDTTSMQTASASTAVEITYNPTINISGEMSAKSREDFLSLLKRNASEIAKMIKEEGRKNERANYGIPQIG